MYTLYMCVTGTARSLKDTKLTYKTVLTGATHADAQGEQKQTPTRYVRKCTHNNKKP